MWGGEKYDNLNIHEDYLMRTVPYTSEEIQRVTRLFALERRAIKEYYENPDFNLTTVRAGIAKERRRISRAARKREIDGRKDAD